MLETRFVPKLDRTVTRLGLGALPMGPLQRTLSVEEGARVRVGLWLVALGAIVGADEP